MKIHPGIETVDYPTSEYNLAGKEFFLARKSMSNYSSLGEDLRLRITVVGGGTDTLDFSQAVSSILKDLETDFIVRLIAGEKTSKVNDERFKVIEQGDIIDVLSRDSDLVLTTASTTALEFISAGCAVGIARAVSNQCGNYNKLVELGVAYPIGHYSNNSWNLDSTSISELVADNSLRIHLRNNARNWLDKDGQKRVVNAILSYVEKKSKGLFQ
jgi:spore coat polysaccharide biosynthesis predicted glycosyltransferase SpsG